MAVHMTICNDLDYFLRHRLFVPQELRRLGHKVIVLTGGRSATELAEDEIEFEHVEIDRFSFSPIGDLRLFLKTSMLIWKKRPESLHLITLKPAVYAGIAAVIMHKFAGSPAKVLITIPGLGRLLAPGSKLSGLKARTARHLSLTILRMLGRRIFVHFTFETGHDRQTMIDHGIVNEFNSTVIAGAGVDAEMYRPSQNTDGAKKTRVLFASRLLKSKGIDAFLKAAEISERKSDIEYVIAGIEDKSDPDSFDAQTIAPDGVVTYLGEEKDMASLLNTIDIVCLPTLYGEGIPRILIEAAACGIPTITTQHPGCMEITKDRHTGITITMGNTTFMAKELIAAIEIYANDRDLITEHGRNARRLFESGGFSKAAVTDAFLKLLGVTT